MHIRLLVEQHLCAEVAHALVAKPWGCDQLEALKLCKMRRVAEHVDVQDLQQWAMEAVYADARTRKQYNP
jgi:hypothetical protein